MANISFICKDIEEKLKIFYVGDIKNAFQFKMSATIVGHLEKKSAMLNITFLTITLLQRFKNIYLLFNCYLISLFIRMNQKEMRLLFLKLCLTLDKGMI